MPLSSVTKNKHADGWHTSQELKKVQDHVASYSKLKKHLQLYCSVPLLDFTIGAAEIFTNLRSKEIRIGTMDLKIAAICLDNDALLLTCNSVDFEKVSGIRFEDWTVTES